MKTHFLTALRTLLVFTALTGFAYPLLVTGIAGVLFPGQAGGSLVERDGHVIGSSLLAQKTESPRYFHPRPSACDYGTMASGASNLSPSSQSLRQAVAERADALGKPQAEIPIELLTASGSGLDPHLSPEAAMFQAERIATARGLPVDKVKALIERLSQHSSLAPSLVNVLELNLALDAASP
jgi:K+-transporting ATPase ATPase C chain